MGFSSPQSDSAYLPLWMIENLGIKVGDKVELQSQFDIPKGNFCKLQPFKQDFMDKVSTIGYKSILEHSLRHYSVLSINQRIVVEFNHFAYECIVKELKPANAISILGSTDLEIEFDEPLEVVNANATATDTAIVNVDEEKTVSHENEQEEDEEEEEESANGFGGFGDIDIVDATVEDREDDSSFVDSDIIDNGYQSNNVDAVQVNKEEIDGALLNKLGVPLDYNEQNQLATMIVENRLIEQQNDTTLQDEDQNQNEE